MLNTRSTGGREAVIGVLGILALILFGVLRYPAVLREGGAAGIVVPVAVLAVYGLVAWRIGRFSEGEAPIALRQGRDVGLLLGVVMAAHLTIENFVDLAAPWNAVLSLGLFPVLFFAFGYAGFRGAARTGQWRWGVAASVWSAMLCMVLICVYGFAVNYLFMPRMEHILQNSPEFTRSGMHDLKAFTVANCLESCASHLIIAPLLAVIFGGVGGALETGAARRRLTPRGAGDRDSAPKSFNAKKGDKLPYAKTV